MRIEKFASDVKKEEEGVWCEVDTTSKILVARSNNPKFVAAMRKALAPHRQALRAGTMSNDMADDILNKVMSETVLLDWDGFTEHGQPLAYSKAKAYELLKSAHLKDFRQLVITLSEDGELFRQESLEADAGN